MFTLPPPRPRYKRILFHRHTHSGKPTRIPVGEKCPVYECTCRPFSETHLGKLPGEIRNQIYEMVLTLEPQDGISIKMSRQAVAPESSQGKVIPASRLSILQTCRQVYEESYHLFYANHTLFLSGAENLLNFLNSVGAKRRDEIRSLHVEGLVAEQPLFDEEFLQKMCAIHSAGFYERLKSSTMHRPHADAILSAELLYGSGNLRKIYIDTKDGQSTAYLQWLRNIPGIGLRRLDLESHHHWTVLPDFHWFPSWNGSLYTASELWEAPLTDYRVQVDIFPGPTGMNAQQRDRLERRQNGRRRRLGYSGPYRHPSSYHESFEQMRNESIDTDEEVALDLAYSYKPSTFHSTFHSGIESGLHALSLADTSTDDEHDSDGDIALDTRSTDEDEDSEGYGSDRSNEYGEAHFSDDDDGSE